ncbi:site-specific tyrosine recombinase/integron integrase [uncultured Bacteroides sp.]|uniref:site-specific tyrosine recombinase/integron integrase n=1 Tax=uncultured Bacteroides sp. TaxID=162156 RepID=UPI002AA7C961|nr:site-specific tyrosine recombinase/integron integrase [uncultured Bacteroides sp.]
MLAENVFLEYLRYERNYSDKTIISYGSDISQFHEFVQKKVEVFDPASVNSQMVRDWIIALMEKGYTATSVNRKLSSLRSFYKFLLRNKNIKFDPLRNVTGPKNRKVLPSFLKEREMDELLDKTDFGGGFIACRDRLIIEMFYATGIRLSELIGLNDSDVDFSCSQLKVTGKRNKQRIIPFGDELKESMLVYVGIRGEEVLMKDLSSNAFFVRINGKRLYDSLVYNVVKRNLSKVVTLKKRSPHVLRHTFATSMLNNEAELGAVKELLGHNSLSATEIYTHTTFEELKKVYKQAHPRA